MRKRRTSAKSAALAGAMLAVSAISASADELRQSAEPAAFAATDQWYRAAPLRGPAMRSESAMLLSDADLDTVAGGAARHSAAFWGEVALKAAEIYCGALCAVGRMR